MLVVADAAIIGEELECGNDLVIKASGMLARDRRGQVAQPVVKLGRQAVVHDGPCMPLNRSELSS